MAKVLGGDIPMNDLNAYYFDLSSNLKNTENASLRQANSIWIRDNKEMIQVPDTFLEIVKNNYRAQAFSALFDDSTLADINNWVNYNTDGMIPQLLDEISTDAVMYLVNTLCFDAKWDKQYSEYSVREGSFITADGKPVTAEFMNGEEGIYLQDKQATGFVKYYKDCHYSFAAVLPNKDISLEDYISGMTGESLGNLLNSRSKETVITDMPKYSFDYKILLNDALKEMGMPTAFSADADFTGLNSLGETYISKVLHKTHITVNEAGTKAAAATVVEMTKNGISLDAKTVSLNRPFLFMILDENTNLPVFIGCVTDPTAK
jgi:serpin B